MRSARQHGACSGPRRGESLTSPAVPRAGHVLRGPRKFPPLPDARSPPIRRPRPSSRAGCWSAAALDHLTGHGYRPRPAGRTAGPPDAALVEPVPCGPETSACRASDGAAGVHGGVAQWLEQRLHKPRVGGSSPSTATPSFAPRHFGARLCGGREGGDRTARCVRRSPNRRSAWVARNGLNGSAGAALARRASDASSSFGIRVPRPCTAASQLACAPGFGARRARAVDALRYFACANRERAAKDAPLTGLRSRLETRT